MIISKASGGGRLEKIASYARAKRVGPFAFVSGTTSMQSDGTVYAPYDTAAQTEYILKRMEEALHAVGAELSHVVRTRAYLTDMRDAGGFIKVHGEIFKGIEPTLTGVQAGLTTPGMMVEIELDAIVHTDAVYADNTPAEASSPQELESDAAEADGHSAEFKAKVVLEAMSGKLTLADLGAKHGVNPLLIDKWQREATNNMADVFSG